MSVLEKIKIPGVVWAAILVAVSWFLATNFPDEVWYPIVAVIITAVVKALEVSLVPNLPDTPLSPPPNRMRGIEKDFAIASPEDYSQHKFRRWMVG